MGIRQFEIDLLTNVLKQQNLSFNNIKMMQLGDQIYKDKNMRAKEYFESLGSLVVSIDIKGEGGSLPIDLSKPINMSEYKEYFDVVTNFGTSEHVSDHMACLENMYYFCKKNGILCNFVPREGHWIDRSHYNAHKYTTNFFYQWADQHNCEVVLSRIVTIRERTSGHCNSIHLYGMYDSILAILKKQETQHGT